MIERRRRFFRGDSRLDMPISPSSRNSCSICTRIAKRNWHCRLVSSGHCYIRRYRRVDRVCGKFVVHPWSTANRVPFFRLCRVILSSCWAWHLARRRTVARQTWPIFARGCVLARALPDRRRSPGTGRRQAISLRYLLGQRATTGGSREIENTGAKIVFKTYRN